MIVLGVDAPNGWAVVDRDRMLTSGRWAKGKGFTALSVDIALAVDEAIFRGAQVLASEGQFSEWRDSVEAKAKAGINRSALLTAKHTGMWIQEWSRQSGGLPVVEKQPAEWRRPVLGRGAPKDSRGLKRAAIEAVRMLYGVEVTTDEADAICIARCVSFEALG